MSDLESILDDLFHGAALAAFVEEAMVTGAMPCPIATKYRANRYYEEDLAKKSRDNALLEER